MLCMTCNGKGMIGSTLRSSYCPTVVCSNCKGSGKENTMDANEKMEEFKKKESKEVFKKGI